MYLSEWALAHGALRHNRCATIVFIVLNPSKYSGLDRMR